MTDGSAIEVRGLRVAFGTLDVLAGLDLSVPSGSFTAILGPSGCGKTTLLRTLAGFERPASGSIAIGGELVDGPSTRVPPELRRIGYVPQEGGLFPHLTVAQNIAFGVKHHRDRAATVQRLVETAGLAGLERRYPHQLSGGQQQRVALARALAVDPRLVLLDEPFAALDDALRIPLREDVRAVLRDARATALLVTHDQDEALSLADQVGVLSGGRIVQCASPRELYEHPSTPDVATFVGESNLLTGTARGARVATALGELTWRRPARGADGGAVLVLVRPEQLELQSASDGGTPLGTVVAAEFHGHDTTVRVAPTDPALPAILTVRVAGGCALEPGSAVELAVRGPVEAWAAGPRSQRLAPDSP